jgi:hypothetical protein
MATTIQFKRGTTAQVGAVTPASGEPLWNTTLKQLSVGDASTAGGNKVAMESVGISRTILCRNFINPAPGTDWTPELLGNRLVANRSAKKFWITIDGLAIGEIITSFKLLGNVHEGGGDTVTFDGKLVVLSKADPITSADVTDGAIAQVTADGVFDVEANCTDTTAVTDKQYCIECLGTTSNVSANEYIVVMGAEVVVTKLP